MIKRWYVRDKHKIWKKNRNICGKFGCFRKCNFFTVKSIIEPIFCTASEKQYNSVIGQSEKHLLHEIFSQINYPKRPLTYAIKIMGSITTTNVSGGQIMFWQPVVFHVFVSLVFTCTGWRTKWCCCCCWWWWWWWWWWHPLTF